MHYNFTVTSLRAKNLLSCPIKGKESFAFAKESKIFPCSHLTSSEFYITLSHKEVGMYMSTKENHLKRKTEQKNAAQLLSYEQELRYNGFQLLSV